MSIELRPLGVACNLACHYCYQNPQRDAGNQRMNYDPEKMKKDAARIGGPFTLFGGEPLARLRHGVREVGQEIRTRIMSGRRSAVVR
jgi:sulfatase maturation enzyme AslB (radical SAM superfamily)